MHEETYVLLTNDEAVHDDDGNVFAPVVIVVHVGDAVVWNVFSPTF